MRKKNPAKHLIVPHETLADKPDVLRSSAEECLQAAEKSKYRAIKSELLQLAEAYIERARMREARSSH